MVFILAEMDQLTSRFASVKKMERAIKSEIANFFLWVCLGMMRVLTVCLKWLALVWFEVIGFGILLFVFPLKSKYLYD